MTSHLARLADKRLGRTTTMIEVVDTADLWTDVHADLGATLSNLDFETLLQRFPALGCAAASEIGYRFEGIGTVFWAKFEALLGRAIPVGKRPLLAEVFAQLADRFALQKPSDARFATHFSIIAWPIANALMPYDLAGPVSRLLARGPASAIAGGTGARRGDLSVLRAWAQSWEGARLVDWLQPDGAASRVLTALITENAKSVLTPASYQRVKSAFARQTEASFALRDARRRKLSGPVETQAADGLLSLRRYGEDYLLSVTWPALPQGLVERGRQLASARGWRPKLWNQSRTAADNMFGSLPITLRLTSLPAGSAPATPEALTVFADDLEIGHALLGRVVHWDEPQVFLGDGEQADRVDLPIGAANGIVWVVDRDSRLPGAHVVGTLAGVPVRRVDLSIPSDRDALSALGWLAAKSPNTLQIARSPNDALTLPRRQVTAESPVCIFDETTSRIERLHRASGAHGLTVSPPLAAAPATPGIFLFERDTAFDALVEERLLLKIQSPIPGARWPVEMMLLLDDEILAYATEVIGEDGGGLPPAGPILGALQNEHIRHRILRTGHATLRVRVGRHPWDTIELRRQDGEVDWSLDDPSASLSRPAQEVTAIASKPFRFAPDDSADNARVRAFRFDDGRLASPGRVEAPDRFGLGHLSGDFSEVDGCRRLHGAAGGVLGMAHARRIWATARAENLAGLAARVRVVREFESPLVIALCGPEWRRLELQSGDAPSPASTLFELILPQAVGDQLSVLDTQDHGDFAARFADAIGRACPTWLDDGDIDDERADQSLSEAFAATLRHAQSQGRMLEIDIDDFDFGASKEQWRGAARSAIDTAMRSPLLDLIAPASGAAVLNSARFGSGDLAAASTFLTDWAADWCLARSQIGLELACGALQFWLAPNAADPEAGALAAMSRDVFLARAVRYVATRMSQVGQ